MGKIIVENVVLVYVELPDSHAEQDLYELEELISTAQGKIVLTCDQKRRSIDAKTVVGSGKLDEIRSAIDLLDKKVDVVIFSCNLNSTQRFTIKKSLNCDVIDKFDLILDIFALRATSAEGKKQVELAQLSYNLATKEDGDFSRQGAGIGTRGPGETKIETNKRIARERIFRLKQELREIEKHRELTRKSRHDNGMFTVAFVGYTNAGKSTLFNRLTGADIYADDKLFATLDTTVRKLNIDKGIEILLCDTVGFINDLPHALLEAFKSTLEEARSADLLINVCDVSDPNVANHIMVTEQVLAELNTYAPIIRVYSKADKLTGREQLSFVAEDSAAIFVSAVNNKNIDILLDKIRDFVLLEYASVRLKFTHAEASSVLSRLNKYAADCSVEYFDGYAIAAAIILKRYVGMFIEYLQL